MATNVLIERHKSGAIKGYPMPNDYLDFVDFLMAQREWLQNLKEENSEAAFKLMDAIRNEKDSMVLAFLSGILHIRKQYIAYLTKGIESCTKKIESEF